MGYINCHDDVIAEVDVFLSSWFPVNRAALSDSDDEAPRKESEPGALDKFYLVSGRKLLELSYVVGVAAKTMPMESGWKLTGQLL
ncbi:unnamed protein product [Cylicocyclus nassatus]|uniref:Uncharacterized protein n=1 Tax=Cylicocyclus nassatus TaxID=53992 RepID=A0AA36GMG0_CYLNA|nr:unnamed protein product [Cylicocyclus nassatus]